MPNRSLTGSLPILASHAAAHCDFFGMCVPCRRRIVVTPAALVERYGPNAITREVMDRIVCKECGRHVETSVSSPAARGEEESSYSHLQETSRLQVEPSVAAGALTPYNSSV